MSPKDITGMIWKGEKHTREVSVKTKDQIWWEQWEKENKNTGNRHRKYNVPKRKPVCSAQ